jgi:hypothetical protein
VTMFAVIAVLVMIVALVVCEAIVQRMEAHTRKQRSDLALLRITASRMDMGGGRIRR